jgi:hypothetical protein
MIDLFSSPFRETELFGAYPGVDFREAASGETAGEADVLLVFTSGEFVIGECKRFAAGLTEEELRKHETLGARLGAPWSFLATLTPSRDCLPIWRQSIRTGRTQPRLVLTGDALFQLHPKPDLARDPFAWTESTQEDDRNRHELLIATLRGFDVLKRLSGERHHDEDLLEFGA